MHNIYELRSRTDKLIQNLSDMEKVLDFAELSSQLSELELKASDPHIWDDPQLAQSTTSQLSRVQAQLEKYAQLKNQLNDIPLLLEMVEEEAESEKEVVCEQISAQLNEMFDTITQWETQTLLSGEYDPREALVTIRSGAGGVDAADWTQMLFRMYLRWAEQHGYSVEVYDISYAEEAGIKSATVGFKFPYAYGMLSVEMGTHRLVRISPFDNQGRRHTSFAEVEVLPVVENVDHIDIAESDIRVDVFRSSGPGGQSVNTTDSAVRITHIPTGIVVSCQNEKSQLQNKASAMKVLSSRLLELRRQEERKNLESLKKDGGTSWGNQMRSYVLHPYQMVKDLRTEYEVGNPTAVLDGDLDEFISRAIHERARICQNS